MTNSDPIVQVRNLRKTFVHGDTDVVALDNIDLDVAQGEFLSLMGPSGSGKSTLLYILAGIDRATSGGREVAFEVGELSAGNMPGVIATQAVGRVIEGEAAIEQHQARLLQALGQLLRAEQLGDGHTELLWWR